MATKVAKLMRAYIDALPERQRRLLERNPKIKAHFSVDPPEPLAAALPTLDPKVTRTLSPQLKDRFAIAGRIVENAWVYLTPAAIPRTVKSAAFKKTLAAHREYWDESAPMQFPNQQLSLFALIGEDLADGDLIYLVWPQEDAKEPELWEYFGQSETRYKDVAAYLEARLPTHP